MVPITAYLVPIAADRSDCVGLMVTTDCGLILSLFLAAILIFGPILGPTWSKKGTFRAKTSTFGAPGRREEARYHESNLGTAAGGSRDQIWLPGALRIPPTPPKGVFWAKTSPFGATGGQEEVHYQVKVCGNHDSNPVGPICSNWDQIWPQVWPPELLSQLGPVLGQKGPLGPPVSTYKAPEWANMTYNYVSYPWVVF